MIGRIPLQIKADTSIYQNALDELLTAIRTVPLNQDECDRVLKFLTDPATHAWLFSMRPHYALTGVTLMISVRPSYIALMRAARSGTVALLALVDYRLRHQQIQKSREAA